MSFDPKLDPQRGDWCRSGSYVHVMTNNSCRRGRLSQTIDLRSFRQNEQGLWLLTHVQWDDGWHWRNMYTDHHIADQFSYKLLLEAYNFEVAPVAVSPDLIGKPV